MKKSPTTSLSPVPDYDSNGRVDWTADAANATNRFLYDTLGRRVTTIDPLGQQTHTAYDPEGRVIATWGATYPVAYEYDAFGRMTAMATTRDNDADFATLAAELAGGTSLVSLASPMSLDLTTWLYDQPTGLLTNKLYADGRGPFYTYTPDGKLATRTWARGVTTTYAYDPSGSLTNILYSDSTPDVSFQYDRLGRQKVARTIVSAHHYAYDPATLALTTETVITGGETNVLSRTQDSLGRSSGLALGADYAVGYGYDNLGRFAGVVATNAGVAVADVRYGYLPGTYLLSGWTNSVSETTVIRNYESNRDLLTRVRNLGGQTVISQFDYQNDALGRRTQRLDTLANMPQSLTNSFGYNARSEVVAALMGTNEYGYAFDPIGNRLASTNSGESFSYTANELNQYLQVVDGGTFNLGHDGDGNITNDGRRAFMWDGENRLLAVEPLAPTGGARRIRCAYDHMSRRVEKAVDVWDGSDWVANATNRFIWDSWLLVGEYGQQATGVVTNWNVWGLDLSGSLQGAGGIGGLICRTAGDGVVQHYFMDANGNVSDVTDASGTNILARYLPGPFGEPRLVSGTLDSNPWQFSTKYWDSETGLGYWGYRYYDPITGRWINRDPIAERGGVNLYVICRNAPMVASDVLGLFGPSIHRDATILWASELGIRDDVATAIGEEDDAVDTAFSAKTFPFTDANWGWHFDRSTGGPDTRLAHASDQYVEAKRFCTATVDMPDQAALRLGRGLHPLQDWVAHGDFNRNRLGEMPNIATAPWVWQFQWAHNWFGDGFNAWEMVDNPDLDAGGANGRATIDVLGNPHPLGNGDTAFSTPFHAGQQRRGLARDKTRELLAEFVVYVIRNAKPCGECRKAFLSLTPAP